MEPATTSATDGAAGDSNNHQPNNDEKQKADHGGESSGKPPKVITVDTDQRSTRSSTRGSSDHEDARTPKHANKAAVDEDAKDSKEAARPSSGSGAFGPPPLSPKQQGHPPMQHPQFAQGPPYHDGRYGHPPSDYHHHHGPPHYGPPPPGYHGGGYDHPPAGWGGPGGYPQGPGGYAPHHHHRPPSYPNAAGPMAAEYAPAGQPQYHRGIHPATETGNNFSRAVSSSFDPSLPGAHKDKAGGPMQHHAASMHHQQKDSDTVSEDGSWRQLRQVASVDEEVMRKRAQGGGANEEEEEEDDEKLVERPASNNSSLTNSPTQQLAAAQKKDAKQSSLDSLSSVASAQEPMTEAAKKSSPSPDGSLDLMKCSSHSSGLLLPSHQRSLSHLSFPDPKRPRKSDPNADEERGDVEEKEAGDGTNEQDVRATADDTIMEDNNERPAKRTRSSKKKSSPLSIECSPPTSPAQQRKTVVHHPMPMYAQQHNKDPAASEFYDRAPSFTYSMDSAGGPPPQHHGGQQHPQQHPQGGPPYAAPPPRPGSSASSTLTPMHVDNEGGPQAVMGPGGRSSNNGGGLNGAPSWELQAQDSFSTGGHPNLPNGGSSLAAGGGPPPPPLMQNFSFTQDYPMLSQSRSDDQGARRSDGSGEHPMHDGGPPLESRNQSFEGGHYHGNVMRTDSMMSYEHMQHRPGGGYQGPFPPHAPSWGSAGSYHAAQRPYYGPPPGAPPGPYAGARAMMRNFSEDSASRTSPPPGAGPGMRLLPPGFQPPPDFRAPQPMMKQGGPAGGRQHQTIMSSPYISSKTGPYGWSKEEDIRLTDIMKKYKNPRDWEPIAKEHNRGRSAKECHERWIRYLKPGVRKGQWTDHEDAIVMEVVSTSSEQPFTRWSDLAQRLPGRVGKQIRDRWVNHLNPNINHLPFSREDDLNLWEGHKKLGKRWVEISTKFFNQSRSENHIKNRWYSASFKKFISNEFGPDAYSGGKTSSGKKDSPSKKKKRGGDPSADDPAHMEAV